MPCAAPKRMSIAPCEHPERVDGICTVCGHCTHEIILNHACYYCGSSDIDGIAVSPKPAEAIVPVSRLVRSAKPKSDS